MTREKMLDDLKNDLFDMLEAGEIIQCEADEILASAIFSDEQESSEKRGGE